MGRPVYPHELVDPDFAWLISNFKEKRPSYQCLDLALLPIVLFETPELPSAETFAREAEENKQVVGNQIPTTRSKLPSDKPPSFDGKD
jgi:hypothetical protein